jgi:hypothetical protein
VEGTTKAIKKRQITPYMRKPKVPLIAEKIMATTDNAMMIKACHRENNQYSRRLARPWKRAYFLVITSKNPSEKTPSKILH